MPKQPTAKSAITIDDDPAFAVLAKAFAGDQRVTAGKLFAANGLKVGGKIFAMIVRGRLVVKLPKQRVDELVSSGAAERFDPGHGRLMKEWATILGDRPNWPGVASEALAYVGESGR